MSGSAGSAGRHMCRCFLPGTGRTFSAASARIVRHCQRGCLNIQVGRSSDSRHWQCAGSRRGSGGADRAAAVLRRGHRRTGRCRHDDRQESGLHSRPVAAEPGLHATVGSRGPTTRQVRRRLVGRPPPPLRRRAMEQGRGTTHLWCLWLGIGCTPVQLRLLTPSAPSRTREKQPATLTLFADIGDQGLPQEQ